MFSKTKTAIVCTLIGCEITTTSFINYHLSIGFDLIILIFDTPNDPVIKIAQTYSKVMIIEHNDLLKNEWKKLDIYKSYSNFLDSEVMARQILNAELALKLALDHNIDWLLHIDSDELFYNEGKSIRKHFHNLKLKNISCVQYLNYESAMQKENCDNFFIDSTLFKVNKQHLTQAQIDFISNQKRFDYGNQFFNLYSSFKSAVRVTKFARTNGVHGFITNGHTAQVHKPIILHYAVSGFNQFWDKYHQLGKFSNKWFNEYEINLPFHLKARDIVTLGDKSMSLKYFKKEVMYSRKLIEECLKLGIMKNINIPSKFYKTKY